MKRLAIGVMCAAGALVMIGDGAAADGPPVDVATAYGPLGAVPTHINQKRSHYYTGAPYPGKGYGWWGKHARKWKGYGPHGTGAYRGFGYGFNGYPYCFRAYKFGYPENTLGPANVGFGYPYYTYFGEGYPGWKYYPDRNGWYW